MNTSSSELKSNHKDWDHIVNMYYILECLRLAEKDLEDVIDYGTLLDWLMAKK